jgi:hypothetical protein
VPLIVSGEQGLVRKGFPSNPLGIPAEPISVPKLPGHLNGTEAPRGSGQLRRMTRLCSLEACGFGPRRSADQFSLQTKLDDDEMAEEAAD